MAQKPSHHDLDSMSEAMVKAECKRMAFTGIDTAISLALCQDDVTISEIRTYLMGHLIDLEEFDREA